MVMSRPQDLNMKRWILSILLLGEAVIGMNISLQPIDAKVDEGQTVSFNCSYSCSAWYTHTMYWLVGDTTERFFLASMAGEFSERSGLQVTVTDRTNCVQNERGLILQELRITAGSAQRFNRTAVQCLASKVREESFDFYSPYAVLLINELPVVTTNKPVMTTDEPESTTDEPVRTSEVEMRNEPETLPPPVVPTPTKTNSSCPTAPVITQVVTVIREVIPTNILGSRSSSASSQIHSILNLTIIAAGLFHCILFDLMM